MKQIRFYQIITAVCCLLLISCGIDKNLKKGEKFLALGEYYDAADQFKQAYTKDTTPGQLIAVYDNLKQDEPKNNFTIGSSTPHPPKKSSKT